SGRDGRRQACDSQSPNRYGSEAGYSEIDRTSEVVWRDTSGVRKVPHGRVKARPFFLCWAWPACAFVVSIAANRFHAGGHHVGAVHLRRCHAGNFLGPTFTPQFDHAHFVRTGSGGDWIIATVAFVEDGGTAVDARSANAGVVGRSAASHPACSASECHYGRSK